MISYPEAVALIALNDDPENVKISSVRQSITVGIVADIYEKSASELARDIIAVRRNIRRNSR